LKKIQFLLAGIVCAMVLMNVGAVAGFSHDQHEDNVQDVAIMPVVSQRGNSNIYFKVNEQLSQQVRNAGPDWYDAPHNYSELVSWYKTLESNYPGYLDVFKANELYGTGMATGGYDLYYVRITNESRGLDKPEVLFLGGPHGDETTGTIGLYWFTDWLMRMAYTDEPCLDYSKDWLRWLIDNREIYIEVSHNPYGFDEFQREDGNDWDLNREADFDGPGYPTGGIWASVNGQTLRAFIDDHQIRVGCDFHGGARMLLYPWGSTYNSITGTSPLSGVTYRYAPPDFYFFDVAASRLGAYIGDFGGDLTAESIGPIPVTVGYQTKGSLCPWAYGANVIADPTSDPYVEDEIYGNYPGSGIFWISPEISKMKAPLIYSFGNDTVDKYGAEVRRFVLHQTDIAQPYIRWQPGTRFESGPENTPLPFQWQVNGSLVVDHTYIQWGTDPDPVHNYTYTTTDYDTYAGAYSGGTGWDEAESGHANGTTYTEFLSFQPGDYYLVVKAQVDQRYADVLHPEVYGDTSFLRLIKERTNDTYYEYLGGSDGIEEIQGQTWWYSSILHITIYENEPPEQPVKPTGSQLGKTGTDYRFTTSSSDPDGDMLYYMWDWGDGNTSQWLGPYATGEEATGNYTWTNRGFYDVKVKVKDEHGTESAWSDPLTIIMPQDKPVIPQTVTRSQVSAEHSID
jgi:hypothetical protein